MHSPHFFPFSLYDYDSFSESDCTVAVHCRKEERGVWGCVCGQDHSDSRGITVDFMQLVFVRVPFVQPLDDF